MSQLQAKLPTDTWVNATWDEYIEAIGDPAYKNARGYYYNGLTKGKIRWGLKFLQEA